MPSGSKVDRWRSIGLVRGIVRLACHRFLIAFGLATWGGAGANGQDTRSDEDISAEYSKYITHDYHHLPMVGTNGEMSYYYAPQTRYATPLPFIELLLNDDVAGELEIVDSQRRDLKLAADVIRSAIEDSDKLLYETGWQAEGKRQAVNRLEGPCQAGRKVVDDILMPHQAEQLKRIFMSFQVRRLGLCAGLATEPLLGELGITPEQKGRLEQVLKDNIGTSLLELAKLKIDAVEKILGELSDNQSQGFQQVIGDLSILERGSISVFIMQLDPAFMEESTKLEEEVPWPEYTPLLVTDRFDIGFDSVARPGDRLDVNVGATTQIQNQLLHILKFPDINERFALSDSQKQLVNELSDQIGNFSDRRLDAYNELIREHGKKYVEYRKALEEEWRAKREELAVDVKNRIDGMLLPFQQEQMKALTAQIGCHRMGLVFTLTESKLGTDLEIADEQKKAIRQEGAELYKTLSGKTIEIERELNAKLLEVLTQEQRDKLKSLTCERIGFETGQLDLRRLLQEPHMLRDFVRDQQQMLEFARLATREEKADR